MFGMRHTNQVLDYIMPSVPIRMMDIMVVGDGTIMCFPTCPMNTTHPALTVSCAEITRPVIVERPAALVLSKATLAPKRWAAGAHRDAYLAQATTDGFLGYAVGAGECWGTFPGTVAGGKFGYW